MNNNINQYISYAELINIYLYLLKKYNMVSISKIIYTTICLKFCKNINCSTNKRNDVISFYFKVLKRSNALSYDNLKIAIESIQLMITNKVITIESDNIKLIKNVDYVKDADMEKTSVSNFINEINSLNKKSFLSEVINCV